MNQLVTAAIAAGLAALLVTPALYAQPPEVKAKMEAAKAAAAGGRSSSSGKPGESKPAESKAGESKPEPAGKSKDDKPGESSGSTVTRPDKAPFKVNPRELEVEPVDGKVQFNFQGQPWQGVLEWLARISGLSLDWQELPGDHLNLRTQREYTLDEARDLINQHLLARGFTLLRQGEVLTVVKLDKLDPALVPQVEPEQLEERDRHEFVQTTLLLDWLPAETAEEELKPLMSPHGKLTKLTATNRLHAVDAVANLISVRNLLAEEQSGRGRERLVRSFRLQYARAEEVKTLLEEFLGLDKKGPAMPMDPNQMRQMQQQMQQMQQQAKNGGVAPKKEEEIAIIANPRENEVIAQAGPETMAIIEQTVKLLDAAPDPRDTLDRQLTRVRIFRLAQLDPETLVKLLGDMGGLDPRTKLTADKDNNSILVNGPLVDHVVVQQVIERLDGSGRSFEVIRLRRLPADYVAGTIEFMMGGEEEEEDNNSYRRIYFYDPFGSRNQNKDKPSGKFRVDADVANNRLLLWANEIELEEIRALLVKLGEIRPDDGMHNTVRVLNVSGEQADEFLRRLQENWAADETHPLVIDPSATPQEDPEPAGDPFVPAPEADRPAPSEPDKPNVVPAGATKPTVTTNAEPADEFLIALNDQDALNDEDEDVATDDPTPPAATLAEEPELGLDAGPAAPLRGDDPFDAGVQRQVPVTISRGPDGRLIIKSDDPGALNAVEDLMYELAPQPKDYHVFKLKYPTTYSYYVAWDLEDFFGVDEDSDSGSNFSPFFYPYSMSRSDDSSDVSRLSQRRPLKFIPNEESRTIIVQGATPEQLKTIEELIELYDQPQSQNSGDLRVTKLFKIKHAQAQTIATAIKDVYRDLLSSNDRALQEQNRQGDQQRPVAERSYTYVMGGGSKDKSEPAAPIKFKGLLSIGIDEDSNTLIVSASTSLMDDLTQLIESLDIAAKEKEAVSVVRTGGGGVPQNLSSKLKEIFGDKVTIVGQDQPDTTPTAEVSSEKITTE